jgi:creatinine amidohydrolase/Fe(II)-dependent formamide hydrolase-like protein
VDAWDAETVCAEVAARCGEPRPLVLPCIPYGVSYHHLDFPGTLSVNPETLARFVYEVGISAARHGITKLVIVNGHGGNMPALQFAAQMINRDAHVFTCVDTGETSDADIARLTETVPDLHAGEVETSMTLARRPHLVDLERAEPFIPRSGSRYLDFGSEYGVEWFAHTARISPSGVLGDPTVASAEKGEKMWEVMIDHLVAFVETLKSMTLEEIHERRT